MDNRTEHETRQTGQALGEAAEHAKAAASHMSEKAKQMGERFGTAWESARSNMQEKTMAGARVTDKAIRDYPYASLGIAFALGLIIGVLANRGRE